MNPEKKVLIPDMEAGCSLSASITGKDVVLSEWIAPIATVWHYLGTNIKGYGVNKNLISMKSIF